jgi:chromosomal replication initiator protein
LPDFYVGPENRLAAFVCSSQETIAHSGNPLLFYGPSGAGKSALAASVAANEAARHENGKLVQMTAVDFARRYAEAVDGDDLSHFRKPIDDADVLVIDDVHLIADKIAAQEELAARLAVRCDHQRATLLTCRRLPTEIRGFRPLLASRMLPGLAVPVSVPGLSTRREILAQLAQRSDLQLDDELVDILARAIPDDAPATRLASAITHLRVWCRNSQLPPSMQAIQSAIDATGREHEPSIHEIAVAVARRFKLKTSDLKGPTRRQQVVRARALAMLLGRKLTDLSLQQIGNYFGGRDHTTVLHACRKTESLMIDNPDLSLAADDVTEWLRTRAGKSKKIGRE